MSHFNSLIRTLNVVAKRSPVFFQHAAAVVQRGRVVGVGYNRHSLSFGDNTKGCIFGEHAEVNAVRNARRNLRARGKRLKSHEIVVIRSGSKPSAPCFHCHKFMAKAGTNAVIFSERGNVFSITKVTHNNNTLCPTKGYLDRHANDNDNDDSDDKEKVVKLRVVDVT